jgi:repressor LexA
MAIGTDATGPPVAVPPNSGRSGPNRARLRTMAAKLSDMQQRLLRFLRHTEGRGYRPSPSEIRDAVGLPSVLAVHKELDDLRDKGLIARNPKMPGDIVLAWDDDQRTSWSEPPVPVPLLGAIAAGQPILAEENIEDELWLPRELVGFADDLFMLRVRGASMTEAGIHDGDYVVVHRQETAAHGDIVVARTAEEAATVKRFSTRGGRILLVPANAAFQPIEVTVGTRVLGKVVTVIRML